MEIVTTNNLSFFDANKVNGIYGDVLDLEALGIDIIGITYDDKWSVKKFLHYRRNKDRIYSIFKYLGIEDSILKKNLIELTNTEFKWLLLAYLLIINKDIIIFDYFDVGLNYKEEKKLINIIKSLKKDGKKILVLSKNLIFLNKVIDYFYVIKNDRIYYEGNLIEGVNNRFVDEPNIVKFIKLANKKNANMDMVLDNNELLKNIYRSVK